MRTSTLSVGVTLATLITLAFDAPARATDGCGVRGRTKLAIVGLTSDQRLICFDEDGPASASTIGRVVGLSGDTALVGIDFRPATGELFGLGNAGGIYQLDTGDAGATFKAQLGVPLSGGSFDVDFNPTVDRLRVVSDTGQNLRVNVDSGTATVDSNLTNPDPATGVTGAAYTNNDADPNTGTTLFAIDSRLDLLVIQAPPNAGMLNTTGKLGADVGASVGFDIYSRTRGATTVDVHAFASLVTNGRARLFKINLFTGRAILRGTFRAGSPVVDIAIPPKQLTAS